MNAYSLKTQDKILHYIFPQRTKNNIDSQYLTKKKETA